MRQRVRDRQQQAVGRRQGRRQAAGRHQAGNHIRQAADFRRRQHQQIAVDGDFRQLHQAVAIDVGHLDQGIDLVDVGPVRDPGRQRAEVAPHQAGVDVVFRQHGQRRDAEVDQEDEEQGPEHRDPGVVHRGRGVGAHQDVGQGGGAEHQAEHEREKIVAAGVRLRFGGAGEGRRMRFERLGARQQPAALRAPERLGVFRRFRVGRQRPFGAAHVGQRHVAPARHVEALLGGQPAAFPGGGQGGQARPVVVCLAPEACAHFQLARVRRQLRFALGQLGQHRTIGHLRHRVVGMLDRQPHGRDQEGDQDDDVLRHLGPGNAAHAAQERADKNTGQPQEDADRKVDAGKARGDQAHRVDLGHHVDEGDDDGRAHRQQAHRPAAPARAAAVAHGQVVGNRVLGKLAQVGRDQQRDQAIAAGPAHDVGEGVEAVHVQPPGQADEAGRRNPVGGGCHAVEQGRHAPPRDIVFGDVRGAADHADGGVQGDRGEHEQVADPQPRHALVFQDRQGQQEAGEADAEPGVVAGQAAKVACVRAHAPSPDGCARVSAYSLS